MKKIVLGLLIAAMIFMIPVFVSNDEKGPIDIGLQQTNINL